MILDSVAAVRRGLSQVGQPDGAGACLANVYKWFGSVQSIGPGAGHYDWAIKGWTYALAADRHPGDYDAPAGTPVFYGPVGAPRWPGDNNYPCGDIGLSIGKTAFSRETMAVFTDSPTGNTGTMTLSARARQIGRPYLGWTETFLGHQTTAGLAWGQSAPPAVNVTVGKSTVKIDTNGNRMYALRLNTPGKPGHGSIYALAPGFIRYERDGDVAKRLQTIAGDAKNVGDKNTLEDIFEAFGVPRACSDANWLVLNGNAGANTWSIAKA